jgi:hypothetical protein
MKPKRINLDLGPRSYEGLLRLQASLEAASQAEILRLALQTLSKLVQEAESGARVMIDRVNGDRVEIVLPGVDRRQKAKAKVSSSSLRRSR